MSGRPIFAACAAAAISLSVAALAPNHVRAAEGVAVPKQEWSFSGIFGHYDRAALQRGFQVYKEVCAGCHGLSLVAFRNLGQDDIISSGGLGYEEDEVKAIAAEFTVEDGPDDEGDMFERAAIPSDRFPDPFPNSQAAAAANGGAVPPDLSLMVKARAGGADYLFALLTGYVDPPADFELLDGLNYNAYFPGHQISMAAPLYEEAVEYADGTPPTLDQMARDVTHFLAWTSEPEMEWRKRMGLKVILFLIVFTALLYAVKRKIWADLH